MLSLSMMEDEAPVGEDDCGSEGEAVEVSDEGEAGGAIVNILTSEMKFVSHIPPLTEYI